MEHLASTVIINWTNCILKRHDVALGRPILTLIFITLDL